MQPDDEAPSVSPALAILLVLAPIVAGGALLLLFDTGPATRLGLFLIAAGVIVGGAVVILRLD